MHQAGNMRRGLSTHLRDQGGHDEAAIDFRDEVVCADSA